MERGLGRGLFGKRVVIGIQFWTTLGIASGTTWPRGQRRGRLPFLGSLSCSAFLDSRERLLSPFISKIWQRCVNRSSKAAGIRSPWNTWPHSPNAWSLVISGRRRS